MPYTLFEFRTQNEVEQSWLISILSDFGFEGFEETNSSLKAYTISPEITDLKITEILYDNDLSHISFSSSGIPDKNWNEEWEKNFSPVVIAELVGIRAPFHPPLGTQFELIIEPKMSFGTGHHPTTALMAQLMLKKNFSSKNVLDFGSGTGVLAILAEKLKAKSIIALDNEEWAYNNCIENIARNNCVNIQCIKGNEQSMPLSKFDVILANINRHVILKNISSWKSLLSQNGILLVSGILLNDEKDIIGKAAENGFTLKNVLRNEGWVAIAFNANPMSS